MDIVRPERRPASLLDPPPDQLGEADARPRKPARWSEALRADRFGAKSWQAYVLALVATAATLAVRLALDGPLGGQPTLVIFTVPIMLSAYLGGFGAGVLATGFSYFLASYYLFPAMPLLPTASGQVGWQQFLFALAGVVISGLNEMLHRARRRAESATLERQQAEGRLRESEEKFRQLAENISDVFWIASPDFKTMHYVSSGYEAVWGYAVESLYARPDQWVGTILTDDRAEVSAAFAELAGSAPEVSLEYRIERPDGTVRWVQNRAFQVRNAAGKLIRLTGIASDITERKHTEEELFRSRETFREILNHIPQRVFWKDCDLVFQGCNHAFAVDQGFSSPDQVIGITDFETNSKAMAERYRSDDQSVIDLDVPKFGFEEPGIAPDGRNLWLKTNKVPLHDSHGQVVAVLGTYEDVTESKLAKLEIERLNADLENRVAQRTEALYTATLDAQRANLAKSEFLSRMSHELRTPMNAILGFAQVLEFEEGLNSEQRDSVGHILKGGSHLLKLINEVLDVSSIEAGRLTLSPEPIALPGLLEETVGLLRPLSAQCHIRVAVLPSASAAAHVQADRQRLKQVLLNLLGNAIKYNRPGGSVTIRYDASEGLAEGAGPATIRLSVTDTGAGLSATQLARLFNPFERLGAEQTRVEGTGLGLVLAKRMVEYMGGTLGVESVAGLGSTFWLELPAAERPPTQMTEACDRVPIFVPDASAETGVLLYVEDNPSNTRLVTRILARRPGIRLLCAETGALGLEMARAHHPDLILLDLHLPDRHGAEVLATLAADPRTSAIPVVVLSADAVTETRLELLAAGARAFMTKPLNVQTFLTFLDQHFALEPIAAV